LGTIVSASELAIQEIKKPGRQRATLHAESPNLDFIRSVAVMLVFFGHLYSIHVGQSRWTGLARSCGQLGVMIFFVHTCLVLMWSLERLGLEGRDMFASFYLRRIFRLYPLSIACVMFAYFFDAHWNHENLLQNLTLTQNIFFAHHSTIPLVIGPIWSLPLEVQMYVLLPILFLLLRNRSLKFLSLIWAICVAVSFAQPFLGERSEILKYAPCFFGGIIAWRIVRTGFKTRIPGWLWPASIVPLVIFWLAIPQTHMTLNFAAFGLALGCAIPLFKEMPWNSVNAASKIVARYSYGIYLSHFAIEIFVFSDPYHPTFKFFGPLAVKLREHGGHLGHWGVFLVLIVFAPLALYHLIEAPGIKVGKRVANWATS
jgi:peptidoglycan/LPS O-acetylase OafA/YrhL